MFGVIKMQVLIETRMNALKLNESKAPKKGCLGRLEGVCADFKNPTRNGRLYPLKLWKKVFEDSLFKEALESKTLFGELDHPEDRFEPLMKKACVVMTDYTIDEDAGLIYAGFDILDTPDGNVLKKILDYGSVVGVSSRGQGDIIESVNGEEVEADSYEFACFDVVATPAVEKARQTRVAESVKKINTTTFKESVQRQINDAETVSDLNIIRTVVRSSKLNDSDVESIVESIEDKCKALQNVGETISTVNESNNTEQTVDGPYLESAKTIRENKSLYKCIKGLKEQVSAYKHREKRYIKSLTDKEDVIESLQEEVNKLRTSDRNSRKQIESLKRNYNKRLYESNMKLKESVNNSDNAEETISMLQKQVTSLKAQLSDCKRQMSKNNVSYNSKISQLQESLSSSEKRVESLNEQLTQNSEHYQENITAANSDVSEYTKLLDEAVEKLDKKEQKIKALQANEARLQESLTRKDQESDKLKKQLKTFQESYTKQLCKNQGISFETVSKSISITSSPKQVETLVEGIRNDIDNYNKLPITSSGISSSGDYLIESITTRAKDSEEDELVEKLKAMQSGF